MNVAQPSYPDTDSFLFPKMYLIIHHPYLGVYVYEIHNKVVAFIALDYFPQLALRGVDKQKTVIVSKCIATKEENEESPKYLVKFL